MKRIIALSLLALFFLSFYSEEKDPATNHNNCISAWGFYGHKRINRMAVFPLPPELFTFYKSNIEFITEHAVDPDKRRYAAKGEAPRHYIDIDHYVKNGEDPFEVVPKKWEDAVAKFTKDTLNAYGIVPWHLDVMVARLTKAFKEKNLGRILRLSSDLGHYVGDAHVPLHTTENYNGQFTGQYGIHGFWESRIPELIAEDWDYFVGKASYVEVPLDKAWEIVKASNVAVDSVLGFEKQLTEEFGPDKKYSFENRGAVIMKVYSEEFSKAYDAKMNGMVERRMKSAIHTVGSFWYTAWIKAGKPDLTELLNKSISKKLDEEIKKENSPHGKGGKIKGRSHDN
ncbi:MAG: S1/P1 Nuclease [Flavobacteriales bacterium]|nr:S1/P1 Nuclease [Flavobacteriales bacterium]